MANTKNLHRKSRGNLRTEVVTAFGVAAACEPQGEKVQRNDASKDASYHRGYEAAYQDSFTSPATKDRVNATYELGYNNGYYAALATAEKIANALYGAFSAYTTPDDLVLPVVDLRRVIFERWEDDWKAAMHASIKAKEQSNG